MKKFLSLCLVLMLCIAMAVPAFAAAGDTVSHMNVSVVVNENEAVDVSGCVAGEEEKYVNLCDMARALNGTPAQFNVEWDGTVKIIKGQPYEAEAKVIPFGDEAVCVENHPIYVDGEAMEIAAFMLLDENGGGYTYVLGDDLKAAIGYEAVVDFESRTVTVTTEK